MKNEKPYVVLLTTGFSIIRMKEFKNAMKYYGLPYNFYDLETADEREEKLASIIKKEFAETRLLEIREYGLRLEKLRNENFNLNVKIRSFLLG